MTDLQLGPSELAALAALIAAEPVPGQPLPERRVLALLGHLIPCDAFGGHLVTSEGRVVETMPPPHGWPDSPRPSVLRSTSRTTGRVPLGIRRVRHGLAAQGGPASGITHSLHLGLRNGTEHVVELWLGRTHRPFTDRDVAVLSLLSPILTRLTVERPVAQPPVPLTAQERRVLMLVTAGCSNPEIAERLSITASTVRKHLEHAYRKLGVGNRQAAVAALQGRDRPGLDLRERLERFA